MHNQQLSDYWVRFCQDVGLDGFFVDLMKESTTHDIFVRLSKRFEARNLEDPLYLNEVFDRLREKVMGSPAVCEALVGAKCEIAAAGYELDAALKKVSELTARLEGLERYRSYYELDIVSRTGSSEGVAVARDLVSR